MRERGDKSMFSFGLSHCLSLFLLVGVSGIEPPKPKRLIYSQVGSPPAQHSQKLKKPPKCQSVSYDLMMPTWKHRLVEVNEAERTAVCAACGPVKIRRANKTGWRCSSPRTWPNGWESWRADNPYDRASCYGISEAEADQMLEDQDGVCAICKGPPNGRYDKYVIDHDHETGSVRGLLCNNCNAAIGFLRDDVELVDAASRYLQKHKA